MQMGKAAKPKKAVVPAKKMKASRMVKKDIGGEKNGGTRTVRVSRMVSHHLIFLASSFALQILIAHTNANLHHCMSL